MGGRIQPRGAPRSRVARAMKNLFLLLGSALLVCRADAQKPAPSLPSETPAKFQPAMETWDHVRRDVMIPMRDGVKLHAVVLVPKGAKNAPILLTRTPYNANDLTSHKPSAHLGPNLWGYDNATEVIVEG